MKNIYILFTLFVLLLSACSAASPSSEASDTLSSAGTAIAPTNVVADSSATDLPPVGENAIPTSIQLLAGLTQLENTALAVTSTQAESLLPVLNYMKELSTNRSATQEQFDALIEQARSILTEEQNTAINNMQLKQETIMSLVPQRGNGGQPPQGNLPQGTPPEGAPDSQPPSGDPMGAPPADGLQPNRGFVPPQLLDALIQLMQNKTASS
ncbi:MAG: hypothetical protein ACXW4Q_03155 [Anaerolineales bacterium]